VPFRLNLNGEITDTSTALESAKENSNNMALEHYFTYQAIYLCLTGDYQKFLDMVKKARDTHLTSEVWLYFFEGVSALARARDTRGPARQKMVSAGRKAAKMVRNLSRLCHENFGSKHALLDAEIAALKGRSTRAISLYNLSIELAKEQGFLMEEGLAYERLGRFQLTLGSHAVAVPYFESARRAYDQWGAQPLVACLDKQLAMLDRSSSQLPVSK
jgi:tetratricopeptide (TPR) repeat protein